MAQYRTPGMIAAVRARAGGLSTQAVSDAVILTLLDEAQRDLCIQLNDSALWALSESATAALTLDTEPYALPSDFLRERLVKYKTIVARRWRVHELDDLNGDNPHLTPSETNPFYYLWHNKLWLSAGTKTAGNYTLEYYKTPTALSTSSNPILGREYDDLMESFAVMRCLEARGRTEEAELLWREYLERCELVNSRAKTGLPIDAVPGDRS